MVSNRTPHVVIVGAGFGGIAAARALAKARVRVTIVDRNNHHVFQPLLYQVATAMLAPADIARPVRELLKRQKNVTVGLAEVTGVDTARKCILVDHLGRSDTPFPYDYLVLATGASPSYFGHDEFAPHAPGMKSLRDATSVRSRVLRALETAEIEEDPANHADLLTFVLVGGGPTGVEMAGALADLCRNGVASEFRRIDTRKARIILAEHGPRILGSFPESLSAKARRRLESLGVEVRTECRVEQIREGSVTIGEEIVPCRTVIWTAGVKPSPAGTWLGVATDHAGRVRVAPDCSVPEVENVFVVGDTASFEEREQALPGVAQVAMQQGKFVGSVIRARVAERPAPQRFRYFDKGNMAVIGKFYAILSAGKIRLSGLPAWLVWAVIHVAFLPARGNRMRVVTQWIWAYFTRQRGSRLILDR